MCIRDWLADAARGLDLAALRAGGTQLLIVLPVQLWALQRYAREQLSGHPALSAGLFCDPSGALFASQQCNVAFATAKLRPDSIHAHTGVLSATLKGIAEGLRGGPQGDPRQQGCALVLREGGQLSVWAHKDSYNADQVPIPVLLAAAGAPAELYQHGGRKG